MPVTINVADVQEDVSADGVSIDIAVVSTNVEVSTQVATPPASATSLDDIEDVTNTSDLSGSYNTYEYTNMNKSLYTGNDGVDVVEVNGNSNVISTYGGDDIINVDGSQNASIDAGEGNNRIDIDANAQSIYVGNDDDSIRIGSNANSGLDLREGDNTLDIAGNSSNIYSGSGDDSILVNGTVNGTLGSGAGNDVINIGSANGNIDSNEGNDSVTINSYSNGSVYLGGGDDTLDVGSHVNQNINAGTGNDTVTVGGKVNGTVDLGAGDDVLKIGEFVQKRIYAAEGNDSVVIEGKVKNDVMGGSGSDSIELQNYSKADWDANKDNVRSYVKEFENIKFNDGTTIDGNGNLTDGSAFNTSANTSNGEVLTTYETTISITATQNDTDASETLSSVIVDVPAGVSVKDASGNELTVTNVQVSILVVSGVATAITLVSADKLTPSEINSISASVTTTETSGDSDSAADVVGHDISEIRDTNPHADIIDENVAEGTYTGVTLSVTDADGDMITYSLPDGVPFILNENGQILTHGAIDFETTPSFTFDVTATSADGTTSTQSITINVTDIKEDFRADAITASIELGEAIANVVQVVDTQALDAAGIVDNRDGTYSQTTYEETAKLMKNVLVEVGEAEFIRLDEAPRHGIIEVQQNGEWRTMEVGQAYDAGSSVRFTPNESALEITQDIKIGTFGENAGTSKFSERVELSDWGQTASNGKSVTFSEGDLSVTTRVVQSGVDQTLGVYNKSGTADGAGIGDIDGAGLSRGETMVIEITGVEVNQVVFGLDGLGAYFDANSSQATQVVIEAYDAKGNEIDTQGGFRESGSTVDSYEFTTTVPVARFELTTEGGNGNYVVQNMTLSVTVVDDVRFTALSSDGTLGLSLQSDINITQGMNITNITHLLPISDEPITKTVQVVDTDRMDAKGAILIDGVWVVPTGVEAVEPPMMDVIESYTYPLDIAAALSDTDASESLSVTITGTPDGAILSEGVNNGDGTWIIEIQEGQTDISESLSITIPAGSEEFTLGIKATATESNGGDTSTVEATAQIEENGTEGDDNITFDTNDTIDGGEGFDTLMMTDDISVDFSTLSDNVSNIEAIDLGEGAQNISSLSLADVMDITDADDVLKIDGDSSDTIELNKQGEDTEWKLGDFKTDAETGKSYQEVTGGEGDSTVTLEISTQIDIQES